MSRPKLIRTIESLGQSLAPIRDRGERIGLVPTMGALHEGHLSLVRASIDECDQTVATIFVNPTQFGPGEDLSKYPRTLESDMEALGRCGVSLVFAPRNEEVYWSDHSTWVNVEGVTESFEGASRATHFRGVATVVLKLFLMVGPDVAYFGQKDYQQSLVIRRMVRDLDVPVKIRVCPIVREPDGLAMSSRNAYLTPDARRKAVVLQQGLCLAEELLADGERDTERLCRSVRRKIEEEASDARIDYVTIVDPETLKPIERVRRKAMLLVAMLIDETRLIDNCELTSPQ